MGRHAEALKEDFNECYIKLGPFTGLFQAQAEELIITADDQKNFVKLDAFARQLTTYSCLPLTLLLFGAGVFSGLQDYPELGVLYFPRSHSFT